MRKLVAHYYFHDLEDALLVEFKIDGRNGIFQTNWIDLYANQDTRTTKVPRLRDDFEI